MSNQSSRSLPHIEENVIMDIPQIRSVVLDNGIPVYTFETTHYEVVKLEIYVKSGRYYETKKTVSQSCSALLREGSKSFSGEIVEETIDHYGGTLKISNGMDFTKVELYCMSSVFKKILPIVVDILRHPLFASDDLEKYKRRIKQHLRIDLTKNDILSYRLLTEQIFGPDHPYGYNSNANTIDAVSSDDLTTHHGNRFHEDNITILVTGDCSDDILDALNHLLGAWHTSKQPHESAKLSSTISQPTVIERKGKQSFQSSIKIGKRLFDRNHIDFPGMYVLNTILGGFFGSRLMTNLREKQGLTYDTYSMMDLYRKDGFLLISADVDNAKVTAAIDGIKHELYHLQNTIMETAEISLVKQYLRGNLLQLLNGPFNMIEILKIRTMYENGEVLLENLIREIRDISPEKIHLLAQKYLAFDDFHRVIVGKNA